MELRCIAIQVTPNLTSFAAKLKRLTDKRDNRGKRHELAFVLGGVVLAIMSGRAYASTAPPSLYQKQTQVVAAGVRVSGGKAGFPRPVAPHSGGGGLAGPE